VSTPEPAPVPATRIPLLLFIQGVTALTVMSSIVVGAHYYLGARLVRDAELPEPWSTLAYGALAFFFLSIFGGFIAGRLLRRRTGALVQWLGFLWMGTFGVLLTATAFSDLVLLVWRLVGTAPEHPGPMRALIVATVSAAALFHAFLAARGTPSIERVEVKVPGLPKGLDGFTIAQITDVHIGDTLRRDFLERVVAVVNGLEADAVAVTGDLIDGSVARLRGEMEPLSQLRGKLGAFYVTGNHEYYHGGQAWEAEVRRLGLTVLHNEHRVVEKNGAQLTIGGVPDLEGRRFDAAQAPDAMLTFAGAPSAEIAPRVLLAHQPRFAKAAQGAQVALQLSGHTHGGQIFPFMFFVKLQQPVIAGLHTLWGTQVYTSKGTGYWGPPFRLGPRSEVSHLTLRPA